MSACTLIFPHQLFDPHPALARQRPVYLLEDSLFFGDPHHPTRFHVHKLALHRASMAVYARRLQQRGHQVALLAHQPGRTLTDVMRDLVVAGHSEFHLVEPVDDLLDRRLARATRGAGLRVVRYASPMFLTPRDWADDFFAREKGYRMARFYAAQRRRMNLLMEDGQPVGGQWSFDAENRKKLPRGLLIPPEHHPAPLPEVRAALHSVAKDFPGHPGSADGFWFPVTHEQAEQGLRAFLRERFAGFGDYEDAISQQHRVVFHSVLTPALNIGLLTPARVVEAALDHARQHRVPLNALEGFLRQVVGWREFIRLVYEREGVRMRTGNFWGHERPLPDAFYRGETGLLPVDAVVRRVRAGAWCHHIERLMVLSNFLLLGGFRPDDVYRWFMELFIDAYDWVMVPNVYDMGLFASGGVFATKPYLSGSAYLRKMSDFPPGPWCETWDALFWSFIGRHRAYFAGNPRLSMMAKTWDRLGSGRQRGHTDRAARFLDGLQ